MKTSKTEVLQTPSESHVNLGWVPKVNNKEQKSLQLDAYPILKALFQIQKSEVPSSCKAQLLSLPY